MISMACDSAHGQVGDGLVPYIILLLIRLHKQADKAGNFFFTKTHLKTKANESMYFQ